MMTSLTRTGLALALLTLMVLPSSAQTDEDAVLAVAQQVFDGINTGNGDLIRSAMLPDAFLVATMTRDGEPFANVTKASDFASQVESSSDTYHERMFETTVHIQEGVALIWATYDFHFNGAFSHCGIDTFSLVRTVDGWKVASITYTVEPEGCGWRPPVSTPSN